MTGRARGYCTGFTAPSYATSVPGPGFGMGWGGGWGRGWRRRHWHYATGQRRWARFTNAPDWRFPPWEMHPPPLTREQEAETLREQASWVGGQLKVLEERIAELEQGTQEELLARGGFYAELYNSQFEYAEAA